MKSISKLFIILVIFEVGYCRTKFHGNFITDVGKSVQFTCAVLNATKLPVIWIKIDQQKVTNLIVLSNGSTLITDNSRISLHQDIKHDKYTLRIKNIQKEDIGLYQCRGLESTNEIFFEIYLQLLEHSIISNNSTRTVFVNEGQSVKLQCYADGFPRPVVSWSRSNNAVLPSGELTHIGNVYEIPSIKKGDRGKYNCIAQNGVGLEVRHNASIYVRFGPIIIAAYPKIINGVHNKVDFKCHVTAFPLPIIIWQKDGVTIIDDLDFSIIDNVSGEDTMDSTLRINNVEERQYGEYTCKAMSIIGSAKTGYLLFGNNKTEMELKE